SRRRHTRSKRDWSSDVCSSDLQSIVGVYRTSTAEFGVLIPENPRITQEVIIPPSASGGAQDGQVVSARIVQQPETRVQPVGEVRSEERRVGNEGRAGWGEMRRA